MSEQNLGVFWAEGESQPRRRYRFIAKQSVTRIDHLLKETYNTRLWGDSQKKRCDIRTLGSYSMMVCVCVCVKILEQQTSEHGINEHPPHLAASSEPWK